MSESSFPLAARPVLRRLSESIVNRIAAGEVIERPAAALKEIVENAIDAGARRISVSILRGGIDRIVVTDDGLGMTPDELPLAVERHCTSKLADETLVRIATLGFRGEALPSIGAAARLAITSRPPGSESAWRIRVEGGVISPPEPCAGSQGTSVVVEDMFFATPARRKFLKSPRVEGGHVETVIRRLAMAVPGTAFRLEMDERLVIDLPVQDLAARAAALLGAEEADGFLQIEGERGELRLGGYACGPSVHRATAASQYLLVNGRPVADPVLRMAVRVAYRRVIEAGRHPVVALTLDLPPDQVDVNVHPAKTELRFADEAGVRALIIGTLGRALGEGAGVVGVRPMLSPSRPASRIWYPPENRAAPSRDAVLQAALAVPAAVAPAPLAEGFAETRLALGDQPGPKAAVLPDAPIPEARPLGQAVTQLFETYILALAADGGFVLVDQHAAHERLTHERMREQYLTGAVRAQRLLIPDVVELGRGQAEALLASAAPLAALGVEIEAFGGRAVLVRALPALLGGADAAGLLRDLADELASDAFALPDELPALDGRLDAVIARMACHGSIRAGRVLNMEEMNALLRQMEATPRAGTCSHGRPTWLKLGRTELESLFGRR